MAAYVEGFVTALRLTAERDRDENDGRKAWFDRNLVMAECLIEMAAPKELVASPPEAE